MHQVQLFIHIVSTNYIQQSSSFNSSIGLEANFNKALPLLDRYFYYDTDISQS